ncbi:MAG: nitroreductase family protein [Pyrinomonadaceae bacterium MAG19_C2-C3]|nr:nitroreductase family protein [Pyrinomonadaceae bacterium MAG19_C2-C3]
MLHFTPQTNPVFAKPYATIAGDGSKNLYESKFSRLVNIVRARRSTRHFRSDPVAPEIINELLDAARWAPSAFNLQPTRFIVVTDKSIKERLYPACMKQRQVLEAAATVIFTGDRRVAENHLERILTQEREAGAITPEYEAMLRKNVPLSFSHKPLGLGWLWKAFADLIVSRFIPLPKLQAIHKSYWLAKQVSMSAMVFMLAAEAAGLSTCPMEGFSEQAVKRVLGIPSSQTVILIVPLGYANNSAAKTRLPLNELVHENRW